MDKAALMNFHPSNVRVRYGIRIQADKIQNLDAIMRLNTIGQFANQPTALPAHDGNPAFASMQSEKGRDAPIIRSKPNTNATTLRGSNIVQPPSNWREA